MAVDPTRLQWNVQAARESGFDALVCGQATEVLLLTGYWPVMASSVAVMTANGDISVILPKDELEIARKSTSAKLIPYEPAGLHTLASPAQLLRDTFADELTSLGIRGGRIGLQLKEGVQPASYAVSYQFRSALHTLMQELVPKAALDACDPVLEKLKGRKTAVELQQMELTCKVAGKAFASVQELLRPGRREPEVAADIQTLFETAPEAQQLQRSYGYFFCMSGPNSATAAAAYARTRQRRLEPGDLVMIHSNTCGDGYWTDITRTFTVGEPSGKHRQMRAAIGEATQAALSVIHPGVTGSDVDRAARKVMQQHGLGEAFKHATGHGVGFAAADPDGLPRIHPASPDVLETGSTFNVEPAAYFAGYGGMRHCDVVAVGESGVHVLTNF